MSACLFPDGERKAIEEVARVLRPEGRFFISVPDLKILAALFSQPGIADEELYDIMCMMFGSQRDPHDFHYVGVWDGYLADLLTDAGFREIYRVERFGLFHDDSETRFKGQLVSLSLVAVK